MTLTAGYDRDAPRRAVNLSLNEDLVAKAKNMTSNLSATVESLLAAFVQREQAQRRAEDKAVDEVVTALNDFHDRHGFLSDEFPSL
jgi:antitoxin CcdA